MGSQKDSDGYQTDGKKIAEGQIFLNIISLLFK